MNVEKIFEIINQVLPILLLISLGLWIRRSKLLAKKTVDDLRKLVVNIALPAVLFISFLNIELQGTYFFIFIFTFSLCIVLYFLGVLLKRQNKIKYTYFPYLMTGFEYGMLAISLFGAAYVSTSHF